MRRQNKFGLSSCLLFFSLFTLSVQHKRMKCLMASHQSGSVWVEGVLNIPTHDRVPVRGKKMHGSPWCLLNWSWWSQEGLRQTLLPAQRQGHIEKRLWSSCSQSPSLCLHSIKSVPFMGRPWWLSGRESTCQCRRHGLDPWVGKIPWRRKWLPTLVFLPGKSSGQRSLVGYSPCGHKRVGYYLVTKQQQS